MKEFWQSFTNREIATFTWLGVIMLFLIFSSRKSSSSFLGVIKAFFSLKLIPFYQIIILYYIWIIYFLHLMGLWDISLLKDFILWFVTFALVTFLSVNNIKTYKDFRKLVLEIFAFSTVVDFIVGNYNFNLGVEFVVIPVVSFIAITQYVASTGKRSSDRAVSSFLTKILSFIGISLIIYIISKLIFGYEELFTIANLKSFLISPVLSLLFIPVIYATVIYMKYEDISIVLRHYNYISPENKRKVRRLVFLHANIKLSSWIKAKDMLIHGKYELNKEDYSAEYIKAKIK